MSKHLAQRFHSFFQAFWLAPVEGKSERTFNFNSTGPGCWAVIREARTGKPLANFCAQPQSNVIQFNLKEWMGEAKSIVLYLFGTPADADQYFKEAKEWTSSELKLFEDPKTETMIPDVSFDPQNRIREVRHQLSPSDGKSDSGRNELGTRFQPEAHDGATPEAIARMNAKLLHVYKSFASYDGGVLPELSKSGLNGVIVAAPGSPPEWIPPD